MSYRKDRIIRVFRNNIWEFAPCKNEKAIWRQRKTFGKHDFGIGKDFGGKHDLQIAKTFGEGTLALVVPYILGMGNGVAISRCGIYKMEKIFGKQNFENGAYFQGRTILGPVSWETIKSIFHIE